MRGAIILAGGQSKRFQEGSGQWVDKALALLFGKPLLVHVVENARSVVDEIIICVDNAERGFNYLKVLENYSIKGVRICVDIRFPRVRGPFAAIASGLKEANADHCIILPCDTPLIKSSIIDYLLELVEDLDICVPIHPDGNIEALIFSCKREGAARIAETLCLLGRSKPIDVIRASSRIKFVSTVSELKRFDPELKSFVNINFRSDLISLPIRFSTEGPITRSIDLNLPQPSPQEIDSLKEIAIKYADGGGLGIIDSISRMLDKFNGMGLHFISGVLWETKGRIFYGLALASLAGMYYDEGILAFERAAHEYAAESEIYQSLQIRFLSESAREDEVWCLTKRSEIAKLRSEKEM